MRKIDEKAPPVPDMDDGDTGERPAAQVFGASADTAEDVATAALDQIEARCLRSGVETRDACLLAVVEMLGALLAYGAVSNARELMAFVAGAARRRAVQLSAENDANEARPPLDAPRFGWTRLH